MTADVYEKTFQFFKIHKNMKDNELHEHIQYNFISMILAPNICFNPITIQNVSYGRTKQFQLEDWMKVYLPDPKMKIMRIDNPGDCVDVNNYDNMTTLITVEEFCFLVGVKCPKWAECNFSSDRQNWI